MRYFHMKKIMSGLVILVFTIAACLIIWFLGYSFYWNYQARNWVPVQAKVLDYDLKSSRSRSASSMHTTINSSLKAQYSYSYNGINFTGDKVDFSFGSDNFSDKRRSRQMSELRNGTITVYVNPANPFQSVFDRSLPAPQIAFATIFLIFPCGLGTMFMLGSILWVFKKIGLNTDRFMMPLAGIFHGLPAVYPVFLAPSSLGTGSWVIMLVFLALLGLSLYSLAHRIINPSVGEPKWPGRLKLQQ
jgi:hypothetical protein